MSKFSSNLRFYRQQATLTQQALAKALNVSNSTISNWEKGATEPDITMLKVIADYFSVSVDSLLGNISEVKRPSQSKEVVRVHLLNTVTDYRLIALNAISLLLVFIGFFIYHPVVLGFLTLSLLLVLIYTIILFFKPPYQRIIEGTLESDEVLIYEKPKKGTEKLILLAFGKFLLSIFTILYGLILILETYQVTTEDEIILVILFFSLIISYLLLFIFVYPLFTKKKTLSFEEVPIGFNLWVLTLIIFIDFVILLFPSIAFIFHETTLLDLAFPMQIIPVLLIGNYLVSTLVKRKYLDYFNQYKLLKQNRKTNQTTPF